MSVKDIRHNLKHIAEVMGVMEQLVPNAIEVDAIKLIRIMAQNKEIAEAIHHILSE
jgi:hypothetical protein